MRQVAIVLLLAGSAFGQGAATRADTNVILLPGSPAGSTAAKEPAWREVPATPGPSAGGASAQSGLRHGIFWKASSGTTTVYLLGSIHAATPDLYPLPKQIEAAFRSSTVLVVEVNVNKLDANRFRNLMSAGFYPPGDSLWRHISPEGKQVVVRFCARHGLAPEIFAGLKPWAAILIASSLPFVSGDRSFDLGIDRHFLGGVFRGMRVEQIETMEQQLQALAGIGGSDPERVLLEALQSAETDASCAAVLQDAWVAGDTRTLEGMVSRMYAEAPEFAEKLIARRNVRMAEAVERHLNGRETCFVVVGAAHLVGEAGVVRLLEQKGYRVERVFSTAR